MCKNGNGRNGNGNGELGELTGLQRAFVDAWFECKFNGTEAAKRAGYSGDDNALAVTASRTLRKPKVKAAIDERWAKRGATPGEVAARFTDWMRFDISVLFDEHGNLRFEQVRKHGNMIKTIEWDKGSKLKVTVHDQMKAAEVLAKLLLVGEEKGKGELQITIDI